MRCLTPKQQAILDFIREEIIHEQRAPTIREIGNHFRIRSPNGVIAHLDALKRKGFIRRDGAKARGIKLTQPQAANRLPVVGEIHAGPLHEAIEQADWRSLDEVFPGAQRISIRFFEPPPRRVRLLSGDQLIVRADRLAPHS